MIPRLADGPALVWRLPAPLLTISSGPLGGGLGERDWVLNATVPHGYDRADPDAHLAEIAAAHGLTGPGAGFLTAVDVREVVHREDGGVRVSATTGVGSHPTWASAPAAAPAEPVGTINVVCFLPVRLSDAALVNAVATVAEAKAQALWDAGVPGTGTSTDATALLCPPDGDPEPFGGPRSLVGSALARAVHAAVGAGLRPA
ncbi:adenosylcobinamide amidohydrolase [Actinophytocola xinjiangensis]|uniref:Adenosylcobinamide amidohydrolase n=1 Tax=Actinophytocola xinjiangensis TaxID=485602 RepID=A0A7Z0WCI0_9PSEU|nr:adenosylcobinamide amidohydrolase [Actinophytocola xinjiangensis]OLF04278.1 adenosylcobinamide amidohydrolase [Actinophytocola xinjiangensis]